MSLILESHPRTTARASRLRDGLERNLHHIETFLDERGAPATAEQHPILAALGFIASHLGVALPRLASPAPDAPLHAVVHRLGEAADLVVRTIRLDDGYLRGGIGPVLAARTSDGGVVALVARGRRWHVLSPEDAGRPRRLDPALVADLEPRAYQVGEGLPLKAITQKDLFRFGWRSVRDDLAATLLMTALAGVILAIVPMISGAVVGVVVPGHDTDLLGAIALMLLMLMAGNLGVQFAMKVAMVRIDGRVGSVLRAAAAARLLRLPVAERERIPPPVMAMALRAVEGWHRSTWTIALGLASSALMALPSLLVMATAAPLAALGVLGALLAALAAAVAVAALQQRAILAKLDGGSPVSWMVNAYEAFKNIDTVRATGAEIATFDRWSASFLAQRRRLLGSARIGAVAGGLAACLESAVVLVAVVGVMATGAALRPEASVPFVMASLCVAGAGVTMLNAIAQIAGLAMQRRLAAPLLATLPEAFAETAELPELKGAIAVAGVTYRPSPDLPPVLVDASFEAAPGEYVGIVGPSGSGKTTLLRVILGLATPETGAVFLDGVDIRKLDMRAVRRRIGIVGQGASLFPGTLRENICLGLPIPDDEIWALLERAAMHDDVAAMPLGLGTLIGDTNPMLSGGQVQRLLFARAIAAQPRLIVLDEATSALDPVTQAVVTRTIRDLGVTVIAIAHRLETLDACDRIYRVAAGKVTAVARRPETPAVLGPQRAEPALLRPN